MTGRAYQACTIGLLKHLHSCGAMSTAQLEALHTNSATPLKIRLASQVKRGTIRRSGPHGQSVYQLTDKGLAAISARAQGAQNLTPPAPITAAVAKTKRTPRPPRAPITLPTWHSSPSNYAGRELQPYQGRPGAMDAFSLPSRMGSRLHYRDGRIERMPSSTQEAA